MNRLAQEKSPYLLQHKDNPVDWYPWGSEAFEKAKREDKPILLSVGYSTCHWCHVMGRETFEDQEAAEVLNEHFVCIKVDREERPDIDAVYMKACQAMTGSGGWPMTVFMTPEQKPFFAGTYFPTHNRYGQPGFVELAQEIARLWREDRQSLLRSGEELASAIAAPKEESGEPSRKLLDKAYQQLRRSFDRRWGGFGTAPKFPTPHNLLFLLNYGDQEMADTTLRAMARGGIFDQIGGGFCRYSTDEMWLVPHFEKMLYDNALLIITYTQAYRRTHDAFFAEIANRTAEYLLRELRGVEGGFYCGQDADSDGVEGGYYTLTPEEVTEALGQEEGQVFCRVYGISDSVHVPHLSDKDSQPWDTGRLEKLYAYRRQRTKLHVDDKILLSWNGWTMIALTRSGYLQEAIAIRDFVEQHMTDGENRLYVRYRDGQAAHTGQLDDYAVYALALLELYRTTFDVQYLEQAIVRAEQMTAFFEDERGGYFLTAHHAEQLIHRPKETYDGAIPSGNSVAAMVLETLAQLTGEGKWRERADRQMQFMAGSMTSYPAGCCFGLLAMDKALRPSRELIVCGEDVPEELLDLEGEDWNILFKSSANAQRLAGCAPFTADYPIPAQGFIAYLCENGTCRRSDNDLRKLLR